MVYNLFFKVYKSMYLSFGNDMVSLDIFFLLFDYLFEIGFFNRAVYNFFKIFYFRDL